MRAALWARIMIPCARSYVHLPVLFCILCLSATRAAYGQDAAAAPQRSAGPGGFSLQSADGQFRLRLRGHAQADGRFFLNDAKQRGADTFLLRRVRPIVEATMYGLFDLRIMPDFGGGTTALQDAYIDLRLR